MALCHPVGHVLRCSDDAVALHLDAFRLHTACCAAATHEACVSTLRTWPLYSQRLTSRRRLSDLSGGQAAGSHRSPPAPQRLLCIKRAQLVISYTRTIACNPADAHPCLSCSGCVALWQRRAGSSERENIRRSHHWEGLVSILHSRIQ